MAGVRAISPSQRKKCWKGLLRQRERVRATSKLSLFEGGSILLLANDPFICHSRMRDGRRKKCISSPLFLSFGNILLFCNKDHTHKLKNRLAMPQEYPGCYLSSNMSLHSCFDNRHHETNSGRLFFFRQITPSSLSIRTSGSTPSYRKPPENEYEGGASESPFSPLY